MHTKSNINQGIFYIQGLRPFKDTLPKNVKKILNKKGYTCSEILNKWNYLVGNKISNVIREFGITKWTLVKTLKEIHFI